MREKEIVLPVLFEVVPLDALQDLVPPVCAADDVEAVVEDKTAHLRPRHQHARVVAPVPGDLFQIKNLTFICFFLLLRVLVFLFWSSVPYI